MSAVDHPRAERVARQILTGAEQIKAEMKDLSAAEFVVREYGEDRLRAELNDGKTEVLEADSPADRRAIQCMDGEDRVEAADRGQRPASYLRTTYDVDPKQFTSVEDLRAAVTEAASGGDD